MPVAPNKICSAHTETLMMKICDSVYWIWIPRLNIAKKCYILIRNYGVEMQKISSQKEHLVDGVSEYSELARFD